MSGRVQISEIGDNGAVSRKYILQDNHMIEIVGGVSHSRLSIKASVLHTLSEIFLPSGFPASVSSDYIPYQIFDSLQAFSSSIAGLLSSRAVLEGFGVGNEKATSTNAVLLSVVQDTIGRLATIIFAWKYGPALAPEAKMYRFAADVFNDSALVLDCLFPAVPTRLRIAALCLSGALRAVCGVCGGGAKAALSVHFAEAGNVGELNAKDASQETVIGLLGMLCGSFIMAHVTSRSATWTALLVLLFVHLGTNYLAVRAVILTTLNRQRANIAYGLYCAQDHVVPTPSEVAGRERIFEVSGALREPLSGTYMGACVICTSARDLLRASARRASDFPLSETLEVFRNEAYFLILDKPSGRCCTVFLCFKDKAKAEDRLKAWLHAYELACLANGESESSAVRTSLERVGSRLPDFLEKAKKAGWDLSTDAIVTQSAYPMSVEAVGGAEDKKRA